MIYILTSDEDRYCYIGFDNRQTIDQILSTFKAYNPSIKEHLIFNNAKEEDVLSLHLLFKDQELYSGWYKPEKVLGFLKNYSNIESLRKDLPTTRINLKPTDIDPGMVNSILEFCNPDSPDELISSMAKLGVATNSSFRLFLTHYYPKEANLIFNFWETRRGKWENEDFVIFKEIQKKVKAIDDKSTLYNYLITLDLPYLGLLMKKGLYEARVIVVLGKDRVNGSIDPEQDYELSLIDQNKLEEALRNSFKLWSCYTEREILEILSKVKRELGLSPRIKLDINKYFTSMNTKVKRDSSRLLQPAKVIIDWLGEDFNGESSFKKELLKFFPIGDKMPISVAKNRLAYVYSLVQGFPKTARAIDLRKWFVIKSCWIGKCKKGIEIKALIGDPNPQNFIDILKPLVLEKFKYQTKASTSSIMAFLEQLFRGCGYWRKPKIKYIKYWFPDAKRCTVQGKPGYKFYD